MSAPGPTADQAVAVEGMGLRPAVPVLQAVIREGTPDSIAPLGVAVVPLMLAGQA